MLGVEAKAFENKKAFLSDANALFAMTIGMIVRYFLHNIVPCTQRLFANDLMSPQALKWFMNIATQAMDIRKQSAVKRDDFLNYFLELEAKKNLSREDTAGNLLTVFLDGFETTSYFLGNIFFFLSKNEKAQNRLREEIWSAGEIADYEKINQLPYMEQIINGNCCQHLKSQKS